MSSAVNSPPELAAWARRLACRLILLFRCSSRFSSCHLFSDAFCFSGLSSLHRSRQFQDEGISFSDHVLGERLDRAHRLLLPPRQASRTIAAVAYACGFGDLYSFNRTFRRRLGMTPSDLRGANRLAA